MSQQASVDLCILKAIITNRKLAIDFVSNCSEKLFVSDLWRFGRNIIDYIRIYKDVPTKRVVIEKIKQNKNDALTKYFEETWAAVEAVQYDDREYHHDLETLKSRYSEKLISGLRENLGETSSNSSTDVSRHISEIQSALNNIKSITQVKAFKEGNIREYVKDFQIQYQAKLNDPSFGVGIPTGYKFFDWETGGLKGGELALFGGITAAGKSILLGNIAVNMWMSDNNIEMISDFRKGYNILVLSLEMRWEDYFSRLLARIAMVEQKHLRDATLTDEEKGRVAKAFKFIKAYPHTIKIIDIPKLSSDTLEVLINNEIAVGNKPDCVILDYINLMKPSVRGEKQDWLQQAEISEEVHTLARMYEIPIVSAVQINPRKEKSNDGSGFGIQNIRRSSQIGDNADFMALIQSRPQEHQYPTMIIEMVKNRRGSLTTGRLKKQLACCALLEDNTDNNGGDIEDISGMVE
jgi:replicative DNA helicase